MENVILDENYFDKLVEFLRDKGEYDIHVIADREGLFCRIEGNRILGGFYIGKAPSMPRYINYRVAADHEECFDKWRKCPLIMELPVNKTHLLKNLDWLSSDEGLHHSNSYEYLDKKILPYELQVTQ